MCHQICHCDILKQGPRHQGRGPVPGRGPSGTGPHGRRCAAGGERGFGGVCSRPPAPASPPQLRLGASGAHRGTGSWRHEGRGRCEERQKVAWQEPGSQAAGGRAAPSAQPEAPATGQRAGPWTRVWHSQLGLTSLLSVRGLCFPFTDYLSSPSQPSDLGFYYLRPSHSPTRYGLFGGQSPLPSPRR